MKRLDPATLLGALIAATVLVVVLWVQRDAARAHVARDQRIFDFIGDRCVVPPDGSMTCEPGTYPVSTTVATTHPARARSGESSERPLHPGSPRPTGARPSTP